VVGERLLAGVARDQGEEMRGAASSAAIQACCSRSFHGTSKLFGPIRANTSPSRPAKAYRSDNRGVQTKILVTLGPNPVAGRELRLMGRYRILFSVDERDRTATVMLVGEKAGNALVVRGDRS
jgi:hypothetical protein